jgi:hypothetical protein
MNALNFVHPFYRQHKQVVIVIPAGTDCIIKVADQSSNSLAQSKHVTGYVPLTRRLKITPSMKRLRKRFKSGIAYAKSINDDPQKKAAYAKTLAKGKNVYREALKEFLQKKPVK